MNKTPFDYIVPDWPVPENVQAAITLRTNGPSCAPYDHFNLATHVGDNHQQVALNRQQLVEQFELQAPPCWLNQVHGTTVVDTAVAAGIPDADASFSDCSHIPCVVLTADCLPVLLCNLQGTKVAAVHAGWRGLCDRVIGNTLKRFDANDTVLAYLGPAISATHFEVGPEVLDKFLANTLDSVHKAKTERAFVRSSNDRFLADLYALATAELEQNNVTHIFGGGYCSYGQPEHFYSYRRDKDCGRNASLIWLKS